MATFVLVHGGDRDGSVWDETSALLRSHGHVVHCPSMVSVEKTGLSHNIQEILDFVRVQQLGSFILAGHSYGSMVITGVADRLKTQVAHLVFFDSSIPENGQSLYGIFKKLGYDHQAFGLTPAPACLEPLYFDEQAFRARSKTYVHCLQSEFLRVTKPTYEGMKAVAQKDHWNFLCLDTDHKCMLTQPVEVAVILAGTVLLTNGHPS